MGSQYKHQENSNIDIFKNKMAPTNELDLNFTFKNSLLEKVNEYKYLGLIFNSNGKLSNASHNLAQKGSKAYLDNNSVREQSICKKLA